MEMEFLCRIDDFGRVTLPTELRTALGVACGDELAVSLNGQRRELLMRKAEDRCLLCGSTEKLSETTAGYYLCAACSARLR